MIPRHTCHHDFRLTGNRHADFRKTQIRRARSLRHRAAQRERDHLSTQADTDDRHAALVRHLDQCQFLAHPLILRGIRHIL